MNLLFSLSPFGIFTEGPTIDTIFDNFGPSACRFEAPKKVVKFFIRFFCTFWYWYIIGVNLTHFVNKRPILHGGIPVYLIKAGIILLTTDACIFLIFAVTLY